MICSQTVYNIYGIIKVSLQIVKQPLVGSEA